MGVLGPWDGDEKIVLSPLPSPPPSIKGACWYGTFTSATHFYTFASLGPHRTPPTFADEETDGRGHTTAPVNKIAPESTYLLTARQPHLAPLSGREGVELLALSREIPPESGQAAV